MSGWKRTYECHIRFEEDVDECEKRAKPRNRFRRKKEKGAPARTPPPSTPAPVTGSALPSIIRAPEIKVDVGAGRCERYVMGVDFEKLIFVPCHDIYGTEDVCGLPGDEGESCTWWRRSPNFGKRRVNGVPICPISSLGQSDEGLGRFIWTNRESFDFFANGRFGSPLKMHSH